MEPRLLYTLKQTGELNKKCMANNCNQLVWMKELFASGMVSRILLKTDHNLMEIMNKPSVPIYHQQSQQTWAVITEVHVPIDL